MKDRQKTASADVSRYLGLGLTWTLSTLLFLWLGGQADGWLGTRPWLSLIGAFVGAAGGFYYMVYHLIVVPGRRTGAGPDGGPKQEGPVDR